MSKQDSAADTNKQLIERLRGLSPEQRNLLLGQLKQRGINIDEASIFSESLTSDGTKTSRYPLTPSQLHVWLAQQKQPESNAYHIAFRWDITGEIDLKILQQAINRICMRHEALRLSFIIENGQTWQKINDKVTIEIQRYECYEEEINACLAEFVKQPFDLESAPLLRVCAIQSDSSKTNTTLAFIWHHLIADGASRGIFINELSQTYNALVSNQNHSIQSDTHYYSDYLEAYQDWLTSPELERHKHYWKNQLSQCPTPSLPFRQTKVDETDFNSLMINAEFPADLYQQINQLAREQKVTSFVILLAGFFLLLHRYGVGD
ncbi:MAG: condensation domain-containing protein, partial [Pseudomonadota bacterium]